MEGNIVDFVAYRAAHAHVECSIAPTFLVSQYEDGRVTCILSYPDRDECVYDGRSLSDAIALFRAP